MTHNKRLSTAADATGLSILVAPLALNKSFPDVLDTLIPVGHCDTFPTILSANREVKEYEPINDRDFSTIVSTGPVKYDELSFTCLYDFSGKDGVNEIQKAFSKNTEIGIVIEAYDNGDDESIDGSKVIYKAKISKFSITSEKGGKIAADISMKIIGEPKIITKDGQEVDIKNDNIPSGSGENKGDETEGGPIAPTPNPSAPNPPAQDEPTQDAPQAELKAVYYGAYVGATIDEQNAKALTKVEKAELAGEYNIEVTDVDKYLYIIYPASWGDESGYSYTDAATSLEFALEALQDLQIDGVAYKVARSFNELPTTKVKIAKNG